MVYRLASIISKTLTRARIAGKPMLDSTMLNAVLVLMLVTSFLGPILTERFAPRLADAPARTRSASVK
jgi:hypothetical protein